MRSFVWSVPSKSINLPNADWFHHLQRNSGKNKHYDILVQLGFGFTCIFFYMTKIVIRFWALDLCILSVLWIIFCHFKSIKKRVSLFGSFDPIHLIYLAGIPHPKALYNLNILIECKFAGTFRISVFLQQQGNTVRSNADLGAIWERRAVQIAPPKV